MFSFLVGSLSAFMAPAAWYSFRALFIEQGGILSAPHWLQTILPLFPFLGSALLTLSFFFLRDGPCLDSSEIVESGGKFIARYTFRGFPFTTIRRERAFETWDEAVDLFRKENDTGEAEAFFRRADQSRLPD